MTTREIVTVQLGHYSNFVGTHWWNLQESNFSYDPANPSDINPDVLFREGEFKKNITYTPRLLLVDLKGTLGYLSQQGNLEEIDPALQNQPIDLLWEENRLETTVNPVEEAPPFIKSLNHDNNDGKSIKFDLEKDTKKWVDYLVPRFHARTLNIVTEYEHDSSSKPFDLFSYGRELWKSRSFSDEFADRMRSYVEECDMMQGFQVLMDGNDGFGGLGTSCLEYLRDEYNKSIIVWPIVDSAPRVKSISDYHRAINMTLCWQQLNEYASLFSPLCCDKNAWLTPNNPIRFENITYRSELQYHTSALLATALDTLSLRYRQKKYPMSALSDLCADLNKLNRKAVGTSLSLPFPMDDENDLIDVLDNLDGKCPWTSLTPNCEIKQDGGMHSVALRGIPEDRLKRPLEQAKKQQEKAAYRCSNVHEMMSLYLDSACMTSAIHLTNVEKALNLLNPYPNIFNKNIQENGFNSCTKLRPEAINVRSAPVMGGLHSGNYIAKMYGSLYETVKKIRSLNKFHAYSESGIEQDEFEESVNNLLDCKGNYEEHDV